MTLSRPSPIRWALGVLALMLVTLSMGCSVSVRQVVPPDQQPFPALTASRPELLETLGEVSRSVRTLSATISLRLSGGGVTTGVLTFYRQTDGRLVVEKPSHIRMRGQAPLALFTAFDMVSDGERFRVSVPSENKLFHGDTRTRAKAENPILNLRPHHIMDALFVDVDQHLNTPSALPVFSEARIDRRSFYVFEFVDGSGAVPVLLEKIWIDRRDLRVSRKQLFGEEGVVETDVSYSLYENIDGIGFPKQIEIQRPVEDYTVLINVQSAQLNLQLEEEAFVLIDPPGAELIDLNETVFSQLD